MFHIFIADSLYTYTILKLTPYRMTFPAIYNMPGPVSINFFKPKNVQTIRRGLLTLNDFVSYIFCYIKITQNTMAAVQYYVVNCKISLYFKLKLKLYFQKTVSYLHFSCEAQLI